MSTGGDMGTGSDNNYTSSKLTMEPQPTCRSYFDCAPSSQPKYCRIHKTRFNTTLTTQSNCKQALYPMWEEKHATVGTTQSLKPVRRCRHLCQNGAHGIPQETRRPRTLVGKDGSRRRAVAIWDMFVTTVLIPLPRPSIFVITRGIL